MKRLIVHLIVAMVTFSIGAATELLLTVNPDTFAPRLPANPPLLFLFEELHRALVLLSGSASVEGAEVAALAGFWILLA